MNLESIIQFAVDNGALDDENLREAIEAFYTTPQPKQEQGEPVMGVEVKRVASGGFTGNVWWIHENLQEGVFHLYTTPQQRKPLTDEERKQMWHKANPAHKSWASFDWYSQGVADTEAAHGIKE